MDDITALEEQRLGNLQQARLGSAGSADDLAEDGATSARSVKLSFWSKVSQHWLILATALLFDLFGLIPAISVAVNFIFGGILYLYFGSKKKTGGSELLKIGLPIGLGSIFDSILSVLPVNIAAALIRIALS